MMNYFIIVNIVLGIVVILEYDGKFLVIVDVL